MQISYFFLIRGTLERSYPLKTYVHTYLMPASIATESPSFMAYHTFILDNI